MNNSPFKKVLVTGASGFVGNALCERLVAEGFYVLAAIRAQVCETRVPQGVDIVSVGLIGPDTEWSETLNGVDTVVHLAARVHVMRDVAADPLAEFRKVNVIGTERLSRLAAVKGVRRFIFISTIKVNGEGSKIPYTEFDKPSPKDPYGISKLEAEEILYRISKESGMEVVIIRPPIIYGPGVKANFLQMIKNIERGIPLPLRNINNRRSLIYLGNLVDAITTCISHPNAVGQTYVVSDGQDVSIPDLIRMIAKAMGKRANLMPFPAAGLKMLGKIMGKGGEIDRLTNSLQIDSSKFRTLLNWKPPYTVEEGILETVKWYLRQS